MTRSTGRTDRLDALADLDPAGPVSDTALDAAQRARADALLERILATDPATTSGATVPPRPRRRTPRLLLAGGVVTAAAAVVVAVPLVTGGEEAFAGWSPVPVELAGPERGTAVAACSVLQSDDQGELAAAPGAEPTPLVAEARGGWTYVQYRVDARGGGALEASCLMPDDVVADPVPGTGGFFGSLGPAEETLSTPRRADAVREETAGVGEVDDGVFAYASGRVGQDVDRLVVTLADGREVEASVDDGRWAAWWPAGPDGFRAPSVTDAWTYTAVLRDGTVVDPVVG